MSLIIDIIIIFAAVVSIYLGVLRGFVKSVMGFASLLIAIVAVYFFTAPAAAWLNEHVIGEWVDGIVSDSIIGIVTAGEQKIELSKIIEDRPEALNSVAIRFGFDLDQIEEYYRAALAGEPDSEALTMLSNYISSPTAEAISRIAGSICVFFAAMLILRLITFILDLICHLPILNVLNTLLGLLFGTASALISAWVISNMAVGLIRALNSINGDLFNQSVINGSIILRFFYENSLLMFK